ncbi:sulfotransferase family protein [Roseofilum capinflatum]|uniref:Sulfotransferase n=1 Tax=Roseofilum capinflatum BLCC-M114 TaxID=3022440 RepID=A0ABT7B133_9CYAN|nr:sulfotransferase [Roseofilum capinflatum]MDJ1172835.1 sulfotransferase [Roseofilum capinflatum BLCC-M114]
MTMPNFLLIGAAKAGTTSLYYYLKQHPEIYVPSGYSKEPDFFALEGEPLEYPGPEGTFKMNDRVTDLDTYRSLFDPVTTQKAIGEASTVYIYSEKAPERIQHYIPDVKLIAILRDPVERAFSHYLYWASQGFEPHTNFDFNQAIQAEETRISQGWSHNWHYIRRGFYYTQLNRYFDRFDASQIRIYLYEDLIKDKLAVAQNIFEFLGVDRTFTPNFTKTHNKTEVPKNRTVNTLLNRPNPIKAVLKPLLPTGLRKRIATNLKQRNQGKPKLPDQTRKQLINIYRQDILQLQDLINRDLSNWLE